MLIRSNALDDWREITKGYIDWIMLGIIQKDGIEIIRIIQLIIIQ